ncbi:MAG: Acg family FMN-binding oxidoreductase, partial [Verrucomicrobiota bacterium]
SRVETAAAEVLLFQAIPRRRTNRHPYAPEPLPEELLQALAEAARREGAWLECVTDDPRREALGDLVASADRAQWADRLFRGELAAWLRPNDSPAPDGIPGWAEGLGDWASQAGPMVIRTFDLGRGQAAKDREIVLGSPVLAVLGTDRDTPSDWLAAGQALARVLLRARSEEVWASFLNQPVEVEALRPEVARAVGREGAPQALLRLGRAADVPPTRRRPVREVFEDSPNLHREATHDVDL